MSLTRNSKSFTATDGRRLITKIDGKQPEAGEM